MSDLDNVDNMGGVEEKRHSGGSSALKAVGIGCGVVLVLLITTVLILYANRHKIVQSVSAGAVSFGAKAMLSQLGLPPDEEAAVMVHIDDLSKKIKDGEVSTDQAKQIFEKIAASPLPAVIMLRGFEVKYVNAGTLTPEEKTAAHVTVTRFAKGLTDDKIPSEKNTEIKNILTITTYDSSGSEQIQLKDTITDEELKKCLSLMKDAADQALIENREFKVDIAEEMRKAIEAGLAAPPVE